MKTYLPKSMQQRQLLIETLDNTIGNAKFVKKDGTLRSMNFRIHISKDVKGTGKQLKENSNIRRVYDMKNGWRSINLATLKSLKIKGVYFVKEEK